MNSFLLIQYEIIGFIMVLCYVIFRLFYYIVYDNDFCIVL